MATCDAEYTDEFLAWWDSLDEGEQEDIAAVVDQLETRGINLPFPYSSDIKGAKTGHMRELRIQHKGRKYRVLYAFNPERNAVLLIGGDKTGDKNWYEKFVPIADALYEVHLLELEAERKAKRHGK